MAKKGRTPSNNEISLWKRFTHGIKQIHEAFEDVVDETTIIKKSTNTTHTHSLQPPTKKNKKERQFNGFDKRTKDKLERGNMPIEGRIDLHGQTQNQAKKSLINFVTQAYHQQKRCLLVVTGKGSGKVHDNDLVSERSERGVIRKNLPNWLSQKPLSNMVLSHIQAAQKDGGAGAFYIYLKNQSKY
jgi:DNA-nicking Smr family endonuclease